MDPNRLLKTSNTTGIAGDVDDDLISFNSPEIDRPPVPVLQPAKENKVLSPIVTTVEVREFNHSVSPPVAMSTPLSPNGAPKLTFLSPTSVIDEDPFDLVERRAQRDGDPWETVATEAASFAFCNNSADISNISTSLNNARIEDFRATEEEKDITVIFTEEVNIAMVEDSEVYDLTKETPPWDAIGDSDSLSDIEEKLGDMMRGLSDQFLLQTVSSRDPLCLEGVRDLSLRSPLGNDRDIALMSPPVGLRLGDFSVSPLNDSIQENEEMSKVNILQPTTVHELRKKENTAEQASTGAIKKILTPRVHSKPLAPLTNSPELLKLPPRLASRLLQPRMYRNKENP